MHYTHETLWWVLTQIVPFVRVISPQFRYGLVGLKWSHTSLTNFLNFGEQ